MKKLTCKTCGSKSLTPMPVAIEGADAALLDGSHDSRFCTCHVCGDNWLAVRETASEGACRLTFIHQMGTTPVLKRVAHASAAAPLHPGVSGRAWEYFLDDDPVSEQDWRETLTERRAVLKSICSN